eukprot:6155266-Heterocapsa_arctica.AAC.1
MRIIMKGFDHHGVEEQHCEATAEWIQVNGREHGFRVPTSEEQAAAYGMAPYLTSLGLGSRGLFDATSN